MFESWLFTLAISALVMFVLFRRARRLFGRQRYSVPRLCFRIGLFGVLGTLLLVTAPIVRGLAPWIGLAAGIAIGLVGIYLTRFESVEGEIYFKPNPYVGAAVLSLFVGRTIYRLTRVGAIAETVRSMDGDPASIQGLPGSGRSSGILFVVIGFYVCYYLAVLIRGRMLRDAG